MFIEVTETVEEAPNLRTMIRLDQIAFVQETLNEQEDNAVLILKDGTNVKCLETYEALVELLGPKTAKDSTPMFNVGGQ